MSCFCFCVLEWFSVFITLCVLTRHRISHSLKRGPQETVFTDGVSVTIHQGYGTM